MPGTGTLAETAATNNENSFRLKVRFWGVRGSIPTPHPGNLSVGGNTTCLEIRLPDGEVFIIDGGTGVRELGNSLLQEAAGERLRLSFFLTHFHWDHIQGLPFFAPLYSPRNEIVFHSGLPPEVAHEILEGQMTHPYFPVAFELLSAKRSFVHLPGKDLRCGLATVRPFPLNHPQGAQGYRFECNGAVIVHASDLEHGHPELDAKVREFAENADILIYDAQYTPEEYEHRRGWGHSTWLEATRIAREANVGKLILFHHDPTHNDEMLVEIVNQARRCFEDTHLARENWTLSL